MIVGIGLDLAEVARIELALERFGERFLNRCFTPGEQATCLSRPRPASALAMRFAAKEAFSKAAGLGMRGLGWREIEVTHDPRGKPSLALHGRAKAWMLANGVDASYISLTDEGGFAAAVVVLEKS
ncbi:MAG: holo-ACP synthase [Desulfarculaceae bacterium]|nr:holo-ACP synthase [Desulfarculaceae bacterium]MCF8049085.1 holo-ACP synthase [Desulfarculaceae bacterium]MCF8064684.1 holo-ACP synthase [Desulfarculaceae bacterium]MCF8099505.1 holo-ACP synthase [Desulfarculaceae bacterium]MCF8122035.1 holo-ACP synthase [Desulfarculaceae bacterium]